MLIPRQFEMNWSRIPVHFFLLPEAFSAKGSSVLALAALVILTGCASISPGSNMNGRDGFYSKAVDRAPRHSGTPSSSPPVGEDVRSRLISVTNEWTGTPYAYGGESRKGIDCSAFVQVLYSNAYSTRLPRSTNAQRKVGKSVRRSDLRTGDLVFFDTGPRQSHVGVYIGNDEFAHASSSSGVTVSSLSEAYWNRTFEEGVRPTMVEATVAAEPARFTASGREDRDYPIRTVKPASTSDNRRGW